MHAEYEYIWFRWDFLLISQQAIHDLRLVWFAGWKVVNVSLS